MKSNLQNKNPGFSASTPKDAGAASQEKVVTPRFLIVKRINGDFFKVNPFVIQKLLFGIVGDVKNLKKIKDGLLIETVSSAQSNRLLGIKNLGDMAVEVFAHKTLNVKKGVIYHKDLLNCSVEEILESLRGQGVIEVKRIQTKVNCEMKDSKPYYYL